ncbi:hypothetical protein K443DRAFT_363961 [Laccaria amethystina LaAM-08-1]|uniref:Uncharacterized protein n=1 Tax=Laccaria amethystina LaAM-08-1 TaxID=1095629 RepID=A0A0C9X9G2_9AGAR|nr:hypothetical protein K443DRAFT_363961 [Laccaria amethystina LaAM-08-1]
MANLLRQHPKDEREKRPRQGPRQREQGGERQGSENPKRRGMDSMTENSRKPERNPFKLQNCFATSLVLLSSATLSSLDSSSLVAPIGYTKRQQPLRSKTLLAREHDALLNISLFTQLSGLS